MLKISIENLLLKNLIYYSVSFFIIPLKASQVFSRKTYHKKNTTINTIINIKYNIQTDIGFQKAMGSGLVKNPFNPHTL